MISQRRSSSSSNSKSRRNSSSLSKSGRVDSHEFAVNWPATHPSSSSSSSSAKTCQLTPSEAPKDDKEIKLLTSMVNALALKLKKRDRQVEKLQESAEKFNDVTLQLENAEERLVDAAVENQSLSRRVKTCSDVTLQLENAQERLVDAAVENQSLSRRVKSLQSTINLQSVGDTTSSRKVEVETIKSAPSSEKRIEDRQVRLQRDSAMAKAGEMAMALAESRAESDDLRDQLAAITALLQQQKCGTAPASPVSVALPTMLLQTSLTNLWMSPKAPTF